MDGLKKIDFKDLRGKELALWGIFLLNLFSFFINIFGGSLFFLFGVFGMVLMMFALNNYYKDER